MNRFNNRPMEEQAEVMLYSLNIFYITPKNKKYIEKEYAIE
jgi:hypothetical protein